MKHVILQLTLMLGGLTYAALATTQATNPVNASGLTVRAAATNVEAKSRRTARPDYDLFGPGQSTDSKPAEPAKPPEPGVPATPTPPSPEPSRPPAKAPQVEIINFTATWCGPCQSQKPILQQLAAEGYKVTIIDIDQNPEMKAQYGVRSIPMTVIEVDGKVFQRHDGLTGLQTLRNSAVKAKDSG